MTTSKRKLEDSMPELNALLRDVRATVRSLWRVQSLKKACGYGRDDALFKRSDLPGLKAVDVVQEQVAKDAKRDVNGVFTEFNTVEMFNTTETRMRFIMLITSVYETVIREVYSISSSLKDRLGIMFKGGSTIRILVKDLSRNFNAEVEDMMDAMMKKSTKLSDYDFELVSLESVPPSVVNRLNVITFVVMLQVRQYLVDHTGDYLDFLRYTPQHQRQMVLRLAKRVQREMDGLPSNNPYAKARVDFVDFGLDRPVLTSATVDARDLAKYTLRGSNGNEHGGIGDFAMVGNLSKLSGESPAEKLSAKTLLRDYYGVPDKFADLCRDPSDGDRQLRLYVSHNAHVSFQTENETRTVNSFALNRIKYGYTVYLRLRNGERVQTDFAGEVLDLSHVLHDDSRKHKKYGVARIQDLPFLERFTFSETTLSYVSYNLRGHLEDLFLILMDSTGQKPWNDAKYGKRLLRMLALIVLNYFGQAVPRFDDKMNNFSQMISLVKRGKYDSTLFADHADTNLMFFGLAKSVGQWKELKRTANRKEKAAFTKYYKTLLEYLRDMHALLLTYYKESRNPRWIHSPNGLGADVFAIRYPELYES